MLGLKLVLVSGRRRGGVLRWIDEVDLVVMGGCGWCCVVEAGREFAISVSVLFPYCCCCFLFFLYVLVLAVFVEEF